MVVFRKTALYYVFVNHQKKVYQRVDSNWGRVNGFSSCSVSYVHTRQVFSIVTSIPIFFYLFGLFYIAMFSFYYRMGLEKLVMCYLSCKVLKFILSALVLIAYAFFIGHEVVAFMLTYVFFFFAFLIFETRFFLWFEMKLKNSKKVNNEKYGT